MEAYNHYDRRFKVTLTDVSGARSFELPYYIKRVALYSLSGLTLGLCASLFANWLQYDVTQRTKETNRALLSRINEVEGEYYGLKSEMNEMMEMALQLPLFAEDSETIQHASLQPASQYVMDKMQRMASYLEAQGKNYQELDNRVDSLVKFYDIKTAKLSAKDQSPMQRNFQIIELAHLNASQEAALFDNVPTGFPTETGKVTSDYGFRKHPLTRKRKFHKGIDFRSRIGDPIYATAGGIVVAAEYNSGFGRYIKIQHNLGFTTLYAHLNKIDVKVGDVVHKGEVIGKSGNSGASAAPHLHYEVHYLGKSLNPHEFVHVRYGASDKLTKVKGVPWDSLISLMSKQILNPTLQLSQREAKSQDK